MLQLLKCKIQEVTVSESSIAYPGSISLPDELLEASGIRQFELVHVNNKTTGFRMITYAVRSKQKGFVSVNGAASHHFSKGDRIHILAYTFLDEQQAAVFCPILVITDEENRVIKSGPYIVD